MSRKNICHLKNKFIYSYFIWALIPFFLTTGFATEKIYAENSCIGAKFSSGEHKQLGDLGFQQTCKATGTISNCPLFTVPRQDNKRYFTYGDLVTLGDFFKNPITAFEDKTSIRRLDNVFRCIDKEGRVNQEQKTHPEVEYPNCLWVYISNVNSFLKLASTNDIHFAWHNIKTYVTYHALAISIAQEGYKKQDLSLFNKAIFINGVADHYLSDAFAAGHLRVPRKQIRDWALENFNGRFKKYTADAFAMILHDHDGKDRSGTDVGILVENSRGDIWTTHSDSSLNICRQDSDDSIRLPAEAISLSAADIFYAFKFGLSPAYTYPALLLVPTAIDKGLLSAYLNDGHVIDQSALHDLRNDLPLPLRLVLSKSNLKRLFENLPTMQAQFAQEVKLDVMQNPELSLRIPQRYLQSISSTDSNKSRSQNQQ